MNLGEASLKRYILSAVLLWLTLPALAWQQRVAYDIEVKLDTTKHTLKGSQHLRYWNNSPDTLRFLWFHLYPNAFRDGKTFYAREARSFHNYRLQLSAASERGAMELEEIAAGGESLTLCYGEDPTTGRVDLPAPLAPGDSLDITIKFRVKIPKFFSRLGHRGQHYEISQWYPKPAVYDDRGWHPLGYHYLGEFYGEFGNFKVGLWLPKNMVVGATGVAVEDPADSAFSGDSLAYHLFVAHNVHDFAWCADPEYLDTTEIHDGVAVRVLTLKRDAKKWQHVLQYARDALDYYGRWYGRYPYATLTVCDGYLAAGGGMEYPNLVIISSGEEKLTRSLEMTVIHEIGHQWFYGLLANNEMDQPWMDEGFNSFSEERYFEEKYGPQANYLAHPRLQRYLPEFTDRFTGYLLYYMYAANLMEQPIATKAFQVREPGLYAVTAYKKPALMLWWLRDYLGKEEFDRLMQEYFRRFCFRHVYWEDFLRLADSLTGRPISKWTEVWINTTARVDLSIASVKCLDPASHLYAIRLDGPESQGLPASLLITDSQGRKLGLSTNSAQRTLWLHQKLDAPLKSIVLDPERTLPDVNRYNNHWPRQISLTLGPRLPSPERYQVFILPLPWYDAVNGLRLGPFCHGGYLVDGGPMVGRHQWTFYPYYGFKSRQLSYSFNYQTPLSQLPMPPRLYLSLSQGSDVLSASLGLMRSWGRALFAPSEGYDLSLKYDRVADTSRFWDHRDLTPGRVATLNLARSFSLSGFRAGASATVNIAAGYLPGTAATVNNFSRISWESKYYFRIYRHQLLHLRTFWGHIAGVAPAQEQFFLSGAFKTSGLNAIIVPGKGYFSAQEHYHVEGSADVPGYLGRHLRGHSVAAVNLSLPWGRKPLALFADAAWLGPSGLGDLSGKDVSGDAGISLQAGPIRFLFPLWINRPLEGEKRWGFRWKIGLAGSGMPLMF